MFFELAFIQLVFNLIMRWGVVGPIAVSLELLTLPITGFLTLHRNVLCYSILINRGKYPKRELKGFANQTLKRLVHFPGENFLFSYL